jgi:integrase
MRMIGDIEMLGHADMSITLRVYAHATPHMRQAAVAVIDALFERVWE